MTGSTAGAVLLENGRPGSPGARFGFPVNPDGVLTSHHGRPESAGNIVLSRRWLTAGGVVDPGIDEPAPQDPEANPEEDLRLVETVKRGVNCLGNVPGPLVVGLHRGLNAEHPIRSRRRKVRRAVAIGSEDMP